MPLDSIESIQPFITHLPPENPTPRATLNETAQRPDFVQKVVAIRASVESFLSHQRATGSWLTESQGYERLSPSAQATELTDIVTREMLRNTRSEYRHAHPVSRGHFPVHDVRRVPRKTWLAISGVLLVTAAVAFVYNAYPIAAAHGADPIV